MGSAIDFDTADSTKVGVGKIVRGTMGRECPLRERGTKGFRVQTSQLIENSLVIVSQTSRCATAHESTCGQVILI
jgi:hypothetical protein